MKIVFLRLLLKDIQAIQDKKTKAKLKGVIGKLKAIENFGQFPEVTKMKGFPNAYRIRIGDYRLGIILEQDCIQLARFVKRNDIYKVFP